MRGLNRSKAGHLQLSCNWELGTQIRPLQGLETGCNALQTSASVRTHQKCCGREPTTDKNTFEIRGLARSTVIQAAWPAPQQSRAPGHRWQTYQRRDEHRSGEQGRYTGRGYISLPACPIRACALGALPLAYPARGPSEQLRTSSSTRPSTCAPIRLFVRPALSQSPPVPEWH